METVVGQILAILLIFAAIAISVAGLIYGAGKLSEAETEMLKKTVTPKYYKGVEIQYYWHDARGASIIETGTIQRVQSSHYTVSKDKHFSRIVPKHTVYEPI